MIIAFPFAFDGRETDAHIGQAKLFISMVRRFIPGNTIVQMSDMETAQIAGVDEIYRRERIAGEWYFSAMANFPHAKFLRADYDVVIREDVSDVFRNDFDIAIAKEGKSGQMNNGMVFVKNRDFFKAAFDHYMSTDMDGWNDIEITMQRTIDQGRFKVLKLNPRVYNVLVGENLSPEAKVLHFKGDRKSWMSDYRAIEELA